MNTLKRWIAGGIVALTASTLIGCALQSVFYNDETAKMIRSTVIVESNISGGYGSGVFVAPNLIVTAKHVAVNLGEKSTVRLYNGETASVKVVWKDENMDIAFLSTDLTGESAKLRCSMPLIGEPIVAVGSPLNVEFFLVYGHVSTKQSPWREVGIPTTPQNDKFVLADLTVNAGASGGPVFDQDGLLIGIVNAVMLARNLMGVPTPTPMAVITPTASFCSQISTEGANPSPHR